MMSRNLLAHADRPSTFGSKVRPLVTRERLDGLNTLPWFVLRVKSSRVVGKSLPPVLYVRTVNPVAGAYPWHTPKGDEAVADAILVV